jgi:hypothetical protein
MSRWEDLDLENRIRAILNEVQYYRKYHFA